MSKRNRSGYPPGPWAVVYLRVPATGALPGYEFLESCPPAVQADLVAIMKAVADAPPPAVSGGGKWEAMTGPMRGVYQAKTDGFASGSRMHYRVFCLLERREDVSGLPGPSLIIIAGMVKPFLTRFTERDYAEVRALADDFLAREPRCVE